MAHLTQRFTLKYAIQINFYVFFTFFPARLCAKVTTNSGLQGGFMDGLYLGLTLVFFAVTVALVYACETLRGQS
jgi:hypothetical protein